MSVTTPGLRIGSLSRAIAAAVALLIAVGLSAYSAGSASATTSRGFATSPAPMSVHSDAIVAAAVARLNVMPEVAYTKYRLGLPVEDLVRERQAEDAFAEAAVKRGIDDALARKVIRDQIVASKMVQGTLFDEWKLSPPPTRDYQELSTLRVAIDSATGSLLDGLANALAAGIPADWPSQIGVSVTSHEARLDPAVGREPLVRAVTTLAQLR